MGRVKSNEYVVIERTKKGGMTELTKPFKKYHQALNHYVGMTKDAGKNYGIVAVIDVVNA